MLRHGPLHVVPIAAATTGTVGIRAPSGVRLTATASGMGIRLRRQVWICSGVVWSASAASSLQRMTCMASSSSGAVPGTRPAAAPAFFV
jgi:hypothetical protein